MRALQAYKSSDWLDASLRLRLSEPNPYPSARLIIEEADSRILECGLDPHQGRDVAHSRRRGRLFGLFWPLMFAQSHTRAAAVLVDEFDASGFESVPEHI